MDGLDYKTAIKNGKVDPNSRLAYHGYPGPYMIEKNSSANMRKYLQFEEPELDFYKNATNLTAKDVKVYK